MAELRLCRFTFLADIAAVIPYFRTLYCNLSLTFILANPLENRYYSEVCKY